MSVADAWQAGLALATATIYLVVLPAWWRERRRRHAADRMTAGALLARDEAEQRVERYETVLDRQAAGRLAIDEQELRRATYPPPTRLVSVDDELAVARAAGVVAEPSERPGRHRRAPDPGRPGGRGGDDLEDTVRLPRWRPPS